VRQRAAPIVPEKASLLSQTRKAVDFLWKLPGYRKDDLMLPLLRALRLRSASGHRTFTSRRRPQRSTAAPGFHFAPAEECEPRVLLSATGGADDYAAWRNATFTVDSLTVSTDIVTTQSDQVSAYDSQTTSLIGLDGVFESTSYRGTGYSVAVIDTGIDYNHPALGGGWGNRVIAGYDFLNGDADPMDDNGHGTHVAGIIGSDDATHYGIAPDVNLIALKVLGANGSGSFGAVEDALQWVIAHQDEYNIVAVNMSLGASNFSSNPYSFLEDEFSTLLGQGVFLAGASGNSFYSVGSEQGLGYPAISTQTVSVGAVWDANVGSVSWGSGARDYTTAADRVTSFTQRSSSLDILAPGAFVTSTYLGGGFATLAGTSMATPVIAGAAALLHQAAIETGQPDFANQSSLLELMQTTGVDVIDGDDEDDNVTNTGLTFKRLDLLAAMNVLVGESASVNEAPIISDIDNQTIVEDGISGALAFSVSDLETAAGSLTVTAASSNATLIPNENLTLVNLGNGNWTIQATPAANQYGGPATITLTVDDGTTTTDLTFDITVTPANDAPTISDIGNQTIIEDGISEALAFSVSDLETAAGSLTVTAASSNATLIPNENLTLVDLGNGNWTIQAAPAANQYGGPATITVTVDDGTTTTDLTFDITVTPANDAPTISDIENQTIVEDGISGTLAFSVSDLETAAGSLTVTALSSNATLIPNENLTLVDLGDGNWTIQAAPAANQYGGPATITVAVDAGTTTTDLTFDITVTPANDVPTISDIGNQTIVEDGISEALAFSVSDLETAAGSLTVTAASSNAALIPNENLTLIDLGNGNWTIQAAPAANQYGGPATITVTVDDGTTTTDLTFDITVTPANDAPTISDIENQTIVEDGISGALAFSVSDVETAAGSLTITAASSNAALIPNENLTLVDLGNGNWTIQAAPASNQYGGPTTITLTVDDGTTTTDLTFDITVTPANDAPAISDIEDQQRGFRDGAFDVSVSALDPNGDTVTLSAALANGGTAARRPALPLTAQY
jgi:VCBS repeat-containing protein